MTYYGNNYTDPRDGRCDDCQSLESDNIRLIKENTALRTRLDALVTAAKQAIDADFSLDSIDALSAAVTQAKGGDREFCIIINGKVLWHDRDVLTYDDVFRWYSMGRSFQSAVLLTVTFSNGPKENPFGSLTRGQSICVCDGLIINVTIT